MNHQLRAALGVLMAVDADGRLKPHPQSPQAVVEPWEYDVLLPAMEVVDRYTDNEDREVVIGYLLGAWELRLIVDADVTTGVGA